MKKNTAQNEATPKNNASNSKIPMSPAEVWAQAAKIMNVKKKVSRKETPKSTLNIGNFESRIKHIQTNFVQECVKIDSLSDSYVATTAVRNSFAQSDTIAPRCRTGGPTDATQRRQLRTLDNPNIYSKFGKDLLFFIFYYFPDSHEQLFASRVLKDQSFRFHTKYKTWFQRLEEPRIISEDSEEGVFLFFDYEEGWCFRKKSEFTFEYKYLENIDL